MSAKTILFDDWLKEKLQDPKFCKEFEALEPAYQVARLRIMRNLTQRQLADLVGTRQPSIARLESGKVVPKLDFLQRVVEALGGTLTVKIEPKEAGPEGGASEPCPPARLDKNQAHVGA